MIITAIRRITLISLFTGVTIAGMISLTTDDEKANQLASIEVSRAQTVLELEQAQAVATITALDASSHLMTLTAAQRAEKAALEHRIEQERTSTLAPIWTASQAVFIAIGTGGACFVLLAGVNSYRKRQDPIIHIRNVPVTRDIATNHAAMLDLIRADQQGTALVRLAQAEASQQVPHSYSPTTTYAPRYAYEYENTVTGAEQTHENQPTEAARVPTFAQLLRSGVIGPNQDAILYGFDDKQEQYAIKFDKLTSTLIFGNSGSGKTTTLANLIGQLALNGFDLLISDPHFGHEESLSARLEPLGINQNSIAHEEEAIARQALFMMDALEKAKKSGEDIRLAWILDEVTAIFRYKCAGVVQQALEAIAQEGRKYKLVAYAASQATRANRFGDSSVRDSFPIIALHRLRRSALRNVGLTSSDEFVRVEKLPVGQFLIDDGKNEPLFLTAPFVEQTDLVQIGGGGSGFYPLPDGGSGQNEQVLEVGSKKAEAGSEAGSEVGSEAGSEVGKHDRKVIELLREGISQRQIIQEIWGVSGGRKYQEAAKQVSKVIANAL